MESGEGRANFFRLKGLGYEGAAAGAGIGAEAAFDLGFSSSCNGPMAPDRTGMLEAASLGPSVVIEGIESSAPRATETLPTGIASLDLALGGGLSTGVLSELVSSAPSSGGQTALLHLLEGMRRKRRFAALVDGADCFDPQTAPPALLEHLLWARCRSVKEALAVADALLRDENLGMVLIDVRGCDLRELRRTRAGDWYRLQRLAERGHGYACVFTPEPLVAAAQTRITLERGLPLALGDASLRELGAALSFHAVKLRQPAAESFPKLVRRS